MSFKILGTGRAVPEKIVANDDLSEMVETSDEWITTRTGIKQRRVMTDETMTQLCVESSQEALERAGVSAGELDLIICATLRGDCITPSQACLIQKGIGAKCPAFDINAACSGFVYALDVAHSYFSAKRVKKVLIVAFEAMSKLVDWKDRNTCVLFGDGGGSVVLGEGDSLLAIHLTAEGDDGLLKIPNTDGNSPFSTSKGTNQFLDMNGSEVFKFAVNRIVKELTDVIKACGLEKKDIDAVILHQANSRILDFAKQRLKMPGTKFLTNLDRHGNTSAGSIPILLDEMIENKTLKPGHKVAMVAFGGGMTTGACVIEI